jgi:hypothetical protein
MDAFRSKDIVRRTKLIQDELREVVLPPASGGPASGQRVILLSLTQGTRGYIEQLAHQINGSYEHGWYDACAVMMRRLLETLIIEAFEYHQSDHMIKNPSGDFYYLSDLVTKALAHKWNLSRNAKSALRLLKDLGDKSAHSRRFLAHRGDIDPLIPGFRVVVQEFLFLAGLK